MQTTRAVVNSSKGYVYRGELSNGSWVDAANLQAGDRLMNDDNSWAEVVSVKVEEKPLTADNLTLADFHTYFVASEETPLQFGFMRAVGMICLQVRSLQIERQEPVVI